MASFRRGSMFVRDPREHSTPLDRNKAARILYLAEALELRSKGKGCRNGALGATGLAVLRVLLLRFMNRATGLCCPSYSAIMAATGLCRQSIADALSRLARAGILRWVRRIERVARGGRLVPKQASNLYTVAEPSAAPIDAPRPANAAAKPFPRRGPLAALAALATRESAQKTGTHQVVVPIQTYVAAVGSTWRDRARSSLNAAVTASRGK